MATPRHTGQRECVPFALVAGLALAVNAAVFPMALTPDSGGYLGPAEAIRRALSSETGSLLDLPLKFRMLGYPALLAGLQHLAGDRLNAALYVVHGAFVVASGTLLFVVLRRLGATRVWAWVLALLYVAAWPRHLAGFVLTDAINNALTAITVCLLVEPLLRGRPASAGRLLLAGGLMALAFLLREGNRYLAVCFLPILLALAWQHPRRLAGLAGIAAFAVPLVVAVEGYKAFNTARFGEAFVTTGGRTVMLQGIMPVARAHADVFSATSPLDAAARTAFRDFTFAEIYAFNEAQMQQGVGEERLADWAFAKYFEAWRRYPAEMARAVLRRLRFDKQASELLNPPGSVTITMRWRAPELPSDRQRLIAAWQARDVVALARVLPSFAGALASLAVYLLFLAGAPILASRALARGETALALALAAMLATYVGYVLVFALVHVTMRYLAGIAVIPVIAAAAVVLAHRRWGARSKGG